MTVVTQQGRAFCTSAEDVLALHGPKLKALFGQRIEAGWMAWNVGDGKWFESEPVVLRVGDTHVELLHAEVSKLWVGHDALHVADAPAWHACWGGDIHLEWRRDAHPLIAASLSRRVLDVLIIEQCARYRSADGPDALARTWWVLSGIGFALEGERYLEVSNGDEGNELTSQRPSGPDFRITSLVSGQA
jgi:hypothetical protein